MRFMPYLHMHVNEFAGIHILAILLSLLTFMVAPTAFC